MPVSVSDLIAELHLRDGRGEDAKSELISRGPAVVAELAARVGDLDRFGKLLSIEAFEALKDQQACSALVGLLEDDDETVVEWSAGALGTLRCACALEPLRRLHARLITQRVSPDWTIFRTLLGALDDLEARQTIIPRTTAGLWVKHPATRMPLFRSSDLITVIDDLARHDQLVLYFQAWRTEDGGGIFWTQLDHRDFPYSWTESWAANVAAGHQMARDNASFLSPRPELLVSPAWINEGDLFMP